MDELRPLPVYPWPVSDEDRALIRDAKISLNLPFKVQLEPGVPGSPTRVLALREPLPFLADHAPCSFPELAANLRAAVAYVLDDTNDDPRGVTVLQQLRRWFGTDGIVEINNAGRRGLEELVDDDVRPRFMEIRKYDPND